MFCKNCGKENKDDAEFCIECGGQLNSSTPNKTSFTRILSSISNKTKIIVGGIALAVICLIVFISISSNGINKKQIINDLENYSYTEILEDDEEIENIEIISKNKSKRPPLITYECVITTKDDTCSYQKNAMIQYNNGSGEKNIIGLEIDDWENWIITPLVGIEKEKIISSLNYKSFTINEEEWNITPDNNIQEFTIINQNTDLENKKDQVDVSFVINDVLQQAKCELTINFVFDDVWKLEEITNENFTIIEKEESKLQPTNEELFSELIKKEVTLFSGSYAQTIKLSEAEISDFKLVEEQTSNKGTSKVFYYTATITNTVAPVNLEIEYSYCFYDGSWQTNYISINPTVDPINIKGVWKGRYTAIGGEKGEVSLEITEFNENGELKAIYSYTPDEITKYSGAGSYEISGTLNLENFFASLEPGNWITEDPSALSTTKRNIRIQIMVGSSTIRGEGHDVSSFTLSKEN